MSNKEVKQEEVKQEEVKQEEAKQEEVKQAPEKEAHNNKGLYSVKPSDKPTQKAPMDIFYDFNDGARIFLPEGEWIAQIVDEDSGNILFEAKTKGGWVLSRKKYFINFRLIVWKEGEAQPVLDHVMNLTDQRVLISFPVGTLGDLIGWFSYAERFLEKHKCSLVCSMGKEIIELFQDQYPHMTFLMPNEVNSDDFYATYRIGLFFDGGDTYQPIDFRVVGLHRTSAYILGVDPTEERPRLRQPQKRAIQEPYVCIAVQSTCQAKYWNNGSGWRLTVEYLKTLGYRVLCIDRKSVHGFGYVWNHIPYGAEDFTGNFPLAERVELLQHADFFIGLGSGLSWLAWASGIPVILISGFSMPTCEFYTPYRVYNTHGCMGCWDDPNITFDHEDFFWCPRHKNTERQYECTRLITAKQVVMEVDKVYQKIKSSA